MESCDYLDLINLAVRTVVCQLSVQKKQYPEKNEEKCFTFTYRDMHARQVRKE